MPDPGSIWSSTDEGSGVYLGNGWVIVARHETGYNSFSLDGASYAINRGTIRQVAGSAELVM